MSDYNKYVIAVNKIFEITGILKNNYPDTDNLNLVESIEENKPIVVANAKLFSNGPQAAPPSEKTPKEGA